MNNDLHLSKLSRGKGERVGSEQADKAMQLIVKLALEFSLPRAGGDLRGSESRA